MGNGELGARDVEVAAKAGRRRFTAEYKLKVLREAEKCTEAGEIGALLRREGLYWSALSTWRRQRERGEVYVSDARSINGLPNADGRANAKAQKRRWRGLKAGRTSGPSPPSGLQAVSRQVFEKLHVLSQPLVDQLTNVLAFPAGNTLQFAPQLRLQINGQPQFCTFAIELSSNGFRKIVFSSHMSLPLILLLLVRCCFSDRYQPYSCAGFRYFLIRV
jgi:transposase-like protein